jgi:PPOX class probable F420-dependent enzyme
LIKIIDATSEVPGMTKEEVERFLESKLNLQLATIDQKGEPNIQPVWFYYNKDGEKLTISTNKSAKKTQNLRNKPVVYFSVDDGNLPYKGTKGKGIANIVEDVDNVVPQAERISMKYLGTLDHPIVDSSKNGEAVIVEISPKFFSTWDYGKMQL